MNMRQMNIKLYDKNGKMIHEETTTSKAKRYSMWTSANQRQLTKALVKNSKAVRATMCGMGDQVLNFDLRGLFVGFEYSQFAQDCAKEIQEMQKLGIIKPKNQVEYALAHADEYEAMKVCHTVDALLVEYEAKN